METEFLTVAEVAAMLRVPKSWIYERTRTGAIPVRILGNHLRFPVRELSEWVERQQPEVDT